MKFTKKVSMLEFERLMKAYKPADEKDYIPVEYWNDFHNYLRMGRRINNDQNLCYWLLEREGSTCFTISFWYRNTTLVDYERKVIFMNTLKSLHKFMEYMWIGSKGFDWSWRDKNGNPIPQKTEESIQSLTNSFQTISNAFSAIADNYNKNEEIKSMTSAPKTLFGNFDFGKVTSDSIRVSMYGLAVKAVDGTYVSYDPATHSIMNVDVLNISGQDILFKVPVAISKIAPNDVIIVNRVPMFVMEVHDSSLKVMDIREQTEKEIYPTKSPFGFNFVTKVINLFDGFLGADAANADNPFGNILPFILMNGENGTATNDLLPFLLMGKGKEIDPMMAMLLLNKDGQTDTNTMLLALSMMKG